MNPDARLRRNYGAAFARFLFHRDEAALAAAYELGRRALESGVGLLDIVQVHHSVVIDALPGIEGPQELAEAAATFLVEVLASYDMTQRAFRERPYSAD
jgi:Phosphoserine phosphatase RsbU, N-terminal domain